MIYDPSRVNSHLVNAMHMKLRAISFANQGDEVNAARFDAQSRHQIGLALCWEKMIELTYPLSMKFHVTPGGLDHAL